MIAEGQTRRPLLALYVATGISTAGSMATLIAILWFAFQTTGSASRTGIVSAFMILPVVASGILGGPLVDRLGHKRASVIADLASGLFIAAIPLLYQTVGLPYWLLLTLIFLRGLADAPGRAARRSLVPDLAEQAGVSLERANSVTFAIVNTALISGLALSGILIAIVGEVGVLWIDALSYGVSAVLIALVIPRPKQSSETVQTAGTYLEELATGLRYLKGERVILAVLLVNLALHVINEPLYALVLPVYSDLVLDSVIGFGFIAAGYGVGSLLASLAYGAVGERLSRRRTLIGSALLAIVPYIILVTLPGLPVTFAAIVIAGLAAGPVGLILTTLIQERVPRDLLGRVFGLNALTPAATPLGVLIAGFVIEATGLRFTLALQGIASVILLLSLFLLPALRELDRPVVETKQEPVSEVA